MGYKDVDYPRRFERGQMIDPVVECRNLAQLLHVLRRDDEEIPRVEIFLNCFKDIAYHHGF